MNIARALADYNLIAPSTSNVPPRKLISCGIDPVDGGDAGPIETDGSAVDGRTAARFDQVDRPSSVGGQRVSAKLVRRDHAWNLRVGPAS